MKNKLNSEFRRLRTMSLPLFWGYLVLVGGLAGLGAWVLVFGGALVFGMNAPTLPSLLLCNSSRKPFCRRPRTGASLLLESISVKAA